jgi:hypothetical protein
LTQCTAHDSQNYKRLKSAWIKENLSRILEENLGTGQQRTPLLDCWVVIKFDTNYVRFGFLTVVLRFKIQVFRDVSLLVEHSVLILILRMKELGSYEKKRCVEKNVKRRVELVTDLFE